MEVPRNSKRFEVKTIGFTGTREGMTPQQRKAVRSIVSAYAPQVVRHGVCLGSDAEFNEIVRELLPDCRIEGHPASMPRWMADCEVDILHEPRPPLVRNRDIVDGCDLLIATPKELKEVIRSGTWATIRYAASTGRTGSIAYPDGGGQTI